MTILLLLTLLVRTPDQFERSAKASECEDIAYEKVMDYVKSLPPEPAAIWRLCSSQSNSSDPVCVRLGEWFDHRMHTEVETCISEMSV